MMRERHRTAPKRVAGDLHAAIPGLCIVCAYTWGHRPLADLRAFETERGYNSFS